MNANSRAATLIAMGAIGISLAIACLLALKVPWKLLRITYFLQCYILLILAFAAWHFMVFRERPSEYYFAPTIQEGKILEGIRQQYAPIQTATRHIRLLTLLYEKPEALLTVTRANRNDEPHVAINNRTRFGFDQDPGGILYPAIVDGVYFYVDIDGIKYGIGARPIESAAGSMAPWSRFTNVRESTEVVKRLDDLISGLANERQANLAGIRDSVIGIPSWEATDFIYLSTVTMTTIGFGDIVPNGQRSRRVVIVQSLCNVFLLSFAAYLLEDTLRNGKRSLNP